MPDATQQGPRQGRLNGKRVLITGAARGQGEHEAREFVAEGASVVLGDVLDDDGRRVADEIGYGAHYLHLDVSDEDQWRHAVGEATEVLGGLDVLVNNAAVLRFKKLEDTTTSDFLEVAMVNQLGCLLGMKHASLPMRASGGGSIINVSSISGYLASAGHSAYVASKFAVRGLSRCAALELAPYGIRVNTVCPGPMNTAMQRLPEYKNLDVNTAYRTLPIPRVGDPREVAPLMVFLASDESSYCTGSEFLIDGGYVTGRVSHDDS